MECSKAIFTQSGKYSRQRIVQREKIRNVRETVSRISLVGAVFAQSKQTSVIKGILEELTTHTVTFTDDA